MAAVTTIVGKMLNARGFVLLVASLSLVAISGCGGNSNDSWDTVGSGVSDGGLGAADSNAGM